MIEALLSLYRPNFARAIIYMLQATEYQPRTYLKWFWRSHDFDRVMHRKQLKLTIKAKLLLVAIGFGLLLQQLIALIWFFSALGQGHYFQAALASAAYLISPVLWAHLATIPLLIGDYLITKPYVGYQVKKSADRFLSHRATKIAVAGSYGKTTMKEILLTILGDAKKVAATPANKNVAISHADFARDLAGDEDILIIEFGEGAPGDVARFAHTTKPDMAIITGLAPAHLDKYKTLKRAGQDIFSLATFLNHQNIYVNSESPAVRDFINPSYKLYDRKGVDGWKILSPKISINGTSFEMFKGSRRLKIRTSLIGEHQIGPVAVAVALADKLGLTKAQIEAAASRVVPFEHRMQPREVGGAWIIDDTYNGNIDGMIAGLELLKKLSAKRKIYITPGLVDQGVDSAKIHNRLGQAIAQAKPDMVILVQHSVTDDIAHGLRGGKYEGELIIEDDPLNFYNNLDQFVAADDLVLLQNDWPDNYD